MTRLPAGVRAVFFDAVGTLIHPEPSAGTAYAEIGRFFDSRLESGEVRRRFAAAFANQERLDAETGYRTDEEREMQRWRIIVGDVLDDVADRESCFRALYDHFAHPAAWRVDPAAREVRELADQGMIVGVASNFDHRLRGVLAGHEEVAWLTRLVISSEVGWKKPAREFFARLCRDVDLPPWQILFVGDDPVNDVQGAAAAGLHARLFEDWRCDLR